MQKMSMRELRSSREFPLDFKTFMWSFTGSLNMFYFGFTMAIYNVMFLPLAQTIFRIPLEHQSLYNSILNCSMCIGVMIGSYYSGKSSLNFGRHSNLVICDFLSILAETMTQCGLLHLEIVSRFIKGFAIGLSATVVFLSETAHPKYKEMILMLGQLNINIAFFVCFLIGILPKSTLIVNWHTIMLIPVIFPVSRAILLLTVFHFETPTYQIIQGKHSSARHTISRFYKSEFVEEVYEYGLKQSEKYAATELTLRDLISPKYFRPFTLGICLTSLQQLSGITGVMFYCTEAIFKKISASPEYWSLGMGSMNLLGTILCISFVKRMGKRFFVTWGPIIQAIPLVALTTMSPSPQLTIFYIILYSFGFCIGLGGVIFGYLGEMLPGEGIGFCVLIQWFLAMGMSIGFPLCMEKLGPRTCFGFFAFSCVATVFFILFFLPETKEEVPQEETGYSKVDQSNDSTQEAIFDVDFEKHK